jgi:hypothetical protein
MSRQSRTRAELALRRRADAPCEPGDEQTGQWLRSELEQMDRAFRAAIERELEGQRDG